MCGLAQIVSIFAYSNHILKKKLFFICENLLTFEIQDQLQDMLPTY